MSAEVRERAPPAPAPGAHPARAGRGERQTEDRASGRVLRRQGGSGAPRRRVWPGGAGGAAWRRRVVGLVLAALAGVALEGVLAGSVLAFLLRAGLVPRGVWPLLVLLTSWVGAEIAGRYGTPRWAGGLVAGLPVLLLSTLLALRAQPGDLSLGARTLILGAVLLSNVPYALIGSWLAGLRARWVAVHRGAPANAPPPAARPAAAGAGGLTAREPERTMVGPRA